MSNRIWNAKKEHELKRTLTDVAARSPNLSLLSLQDAGAELRAIVMFHIKTLVKPAGAEVSLAGPVVIGIRFAEHFLGAAPHPMEIATIFEPAFVFHPNCNSFGSICLAAGGHSESFTMERVLHQVYAAIVFNMSSVNTRPGDIANAAAAVYVRENAHRFPLTRRGLFEELEQELRAGTKPLP